MKTRKKKHFSALQVSNAVADTLTKEARTELKSGSAKVYKSPATFAAAVVKPRRRARSSIQKKLDEVYATEPSSMSLAIQRAQAEAIGRERW